MLRKPMLPPWRLRAPDKETFDAWLKALYPAGEWTVDSSLSDTTRVHPYSSAEGQEPAKAGRNGGGASPALPPSLDLSKFANSVWDHLRTQGTTFVDAHRMRLFVRHSATSADLATPKALAAAIVELGIAITGAEFEVDVTVAFSQGEKVKAKKLFKYSGSRSSATYRLNLLPCTMSQKNKRTKFARPIRRVEYDPTDKDERLMVPSQTQLPLNYLALCKGLQEDNTEQSYGS